MKIALIGYMGSGKSTVGVLLAERLKLPLIDLDNYIEDEEGRSISEIFELKGEIYFRKKERFYLDQICNESRPMILSVGGGTPVYGNNMEVLNNAFISVYLRANVPTLLKRLLVNRHSRPLISRIDDADLGEFIGKHLFERQNFYQRSEIVIDVNNLSEEECTNLIVKELPEH